MSMPYRTTTVRIALFSLLLLCGTGERSWADPPMVNYIFPAGGQRGTTVRVRVGGCALNDACSFEIEGQGIRSDAKFSRVPKTTWFEGPRLNHTDAQAREDYPKDYAGQIEIGDQVPTGIRHWRVWTSQGVTPAMKFVIGDLPEVVEQEIDGQPIPERVQLPVTINGRIFPREDVDIWTFTAAANESITCEVNAARLGSPLLAHLEVVDANEKRIAEGFNNVGGDARVRFTAPEGGTYQLKVRDLRYGGSQSHVYRLTVTGDPYVESIFPLGGRRGTVVKFELGGQRVASEAIQLPTDTLEPWTWRRISTKNGESNSVLVQLDDLPEYVEPDTTASPSTIASDAVAFPSVLNGRIRVPGEVDNWPFVGKSGDVWDFDLFAARLDSPLDSVLTVVTEGNKELARSEDIGPGETDSQLRFVVPANGNYKVRIADQFTSRGGDRFAYRLKVTRPPAPDFQLRLLADSLNLVRGTESPIKIGVTRIGGFDGEITLKAMNLPKGIAASPGTVAAKAQDGELKFRAESDTSIRVTQVRVEGEATIDGQTVHRLATFAIPLGEPSIPSLALAVALPTPFKYTGRTAIEYIPVGSEFLWHFRLDRGGFQGPIKIDLAERQFRHLMGLTAGSIVVPPGVSEFDYPVQIPPWTMLGRTGRAVIVATGTVVESDGGEHKVNFSTHNDDDQIVVQASPPLLTIDTAQKSIVARPGTAVAVPVKIGRNPDLQSSIVKIDVVAPEHLSLLKSLACEVPCGQEEGELVLRFPDQVSESANARLIIRASATFKGKAVIAEVPINVVAE